MEIEMQLPQKQSKLPVKPESGTGTQDSRTL